MEVEVDGAVGGAGDEAKESGGQLGGEEEEEDDVGPRVWHSSRRLWGDGGDVRGILAQGILFGYEGGRGTHMPEG